MVRKTRLLNRPVYLIMKKYNKTSIIETGIELMRKNGYQGTGISDILEACDIPKGSFYNYFKSKSGFAEKVIDHYGDQQLEFIRIRLKDSKLSPINRLKKLYKDWIEINKQEEIKSGCLVNNISNEIGGLDDKLAAIADRNYNKWLNLIARIIAKGQSIEEIRNDIGALELADYFHGSFFGMLSRMKSTRSTASLDNWYKIAFSFISEKSE